MEVTEDTALFEEDSDCDTDDNVHINSHIPIKVNEFRELFDCNDLNY